MRRKSLVDANVVDIRVDLYESVLLVIYCVFRFLKV